MKALKGSLVTYKDPWQVSYFRFVTNLLSFNSQTIRMLLQETAGNDPFQENQTNFELGYFFSGPRGEGIKTKVGCVEGQFDFGVTIKGSKQFAHCFNGLAINFYIYYGDDPKKNETSQLGRRNLEIIQLYIFRN